MADETERITILLQARDKEFARAIDRSNKLLAKFERDAGRATTQTSRTVESNLARIGGNIRAFAGTVLGTAMVAGAGAAVAATHRVVEGIAAIGDQARRSGLGVEAFQRLKFVAEQSRIPVEALVDGIKEMNLRSDELIATGAGPAAEAFGRLGLSASDLKSRLEDPSELMLEIVERMQNLDKAAQIRVADEIFGGTGGERFVELLAQGDEGLRQIMARADELGLVMDRQTIEKASELDRKFGEITARVETLTKTGIVNLADAIDRAFNNQDMDERFARLEQAQALLGEAAVETADALVESGDALDATQDQYRAISLQADDLAAALDTVVLQLGAAGFTDEAIALWDMAKAMRDAAQGFRDGRSDVDEFGGALGETVTQAGETVEAIGEIDDVDLSGIVGRVGGLIGALAAAARQARVTRAEVDAAAEIPGASGIGTSEYGPQNGRRVRVELKPSRLAPSRSRRPQLPGVDSPFFDGGRGTGGKGGGGGLDEYRREVEATRAAIAELDAEAAAFLVAAQGSRELGDAAEYARKRAELLAAAQRAGMAITPELTAEVDALARAYAQSGDAADDAADRMERVQDAAERGAEELSDLFLSVLDGSKSAKEAVSDLLYEIAKAQIREGFLGLAGGGGFLGLLGGLFGKRASGGPVRAGMPYLVNENTPNSEIMVPSQSGAVLTVSQAQAALSRNAGGGGASITFAPVIDARGADQAAVARLEAALATMHAGFEQRVHNTLRIGRNGRLNRQWQG